MLVLPWYLPPHHHLPQHPPDFHVSDYLAELSQRYELPREQFCQSTHPNLVTFQGQPAKPRVRGVTSSMRDNQSIQSSWSFMRKAISILGSISLRCILRRRRV